MDKLFKSISEKMITRYSDRYKEKGYDVTTLGWGDVDQQILRFAQTLEKKVLFEDKTILDIGCGFGDYYDFLKVNEVSIREYIGYDVNPDLISEAQERHKTNSKTRFEVANILEDREKNVVANIGVMLGVLNLNMTGSIDNYEYSKKIIRNALDLVDECLIVDFLSNKLSPEYPKEDFVFYHDPAIMLDFALSLGAEVVLKHDYPPMPQKEFMLFIHK